MTKAEMNERIKELEGQLKQAQELILDTYQSRTGVRFTLTDEGSELENRFRDVMNEQGISYE